MGEIDRQRIAAVRVLEALGYQYRAGEWRAPFTLALADEADTMYALLTEMANDLIGCVEGSSDDDKLNGIVTVLRAYEAKRWPDGKEPGGKG
jgi:hypothetical protein